MMKHFLRSEFACNCGCGLDVVDEGLAEVCDAVRKHFGKPVKVNSGCRCAAHNKAEGGREKTKDSVGSQHLYGRAADIVVKGVTAKDVQLWVKHTFPEISVGHYSTFTHVDSRTDGPKYW